MKKKDLILHNPASSDEISLPEQDLHFTSWDQLRKFLLSLNESSNDYVFAGVCNTGGTPETTIEQTFPETENITSLYSSMIEEFSSGASIYISPEKLPSSGQILEWIALMHYYGAPTNLIQWTSSPFIAQYQSISQMGTESSRRTSSAVWALNIRNAFTICTQILDDKKIRVKNPSIRSFSSPDLFKEIAELSLTDSVPFILPVFPLRKTASFFAQQGVLTYCGNIAGGFMSNAAAMVAEAAKRRIDLSAGLFSKITFSTAVKEEAEKELQQMNISERTLQPGIRGFAQSIASSIRHRPLE